MQCQEFVCKAEVPRSGERCELESPSPVGDSIPTPSAPLHLFLSWSLAVIKLFEPRGKMISFWSVSTFHGERPPFLRWEGSHRQPRSYS